MRISAHRKLIIGICSINMLSVTAFVSVFILLYASAACVIIVVVSDYLLMHRLQAQNVKPETSGREAAGRPFAIFAGDRPASRI